MRAIATTPEVDVLLAAGAPVAIGVSGGKDSCALALSLRDHLDAVGHVGSRVLVHSDLGRVEWSDSMRTCRRLADRLGLELVVVRREAGDMMDRWLVRWDNCVRRYATLSCVKFILPWSTAAMRFCTSEMKVAVICRELSRRFPGRAILSASGIRRDESPKRALAPVAKAQPKLASAARGTSGIDWHPILAPPSSGPCCATTRRTDRARAASAVSSTRSSGGTTSRTSAMRTPPTWRRRRTATTAGSRRPRSPE